MAGYRRSAAASAGHAPRPRQRELKTERARQRLELRYAAATSALERFTAVADHVRLVARCADRMDPVKADHLLRELIERLLADARQLQRIGEGKP